MSINTHKVCFVGDSSCGKTSIINRMKRDDFNSNTEATLGSNSDNLVTKINGKVVNVIIWDTAGQERYKILSPLYVRNSEVIVFVFDLTSVISFRSLDHWYDAVTDVITDFKPFFVGNKNDLQAEIVVSTNEAIQYAERKHGFYTETSEKTGFGVKELFYNIAYESTKELRKKSRNKNTRN